MLPFSQVVDVSEKKTRRFRRPWPLLALMLLVQGCGFGWLYMKIGDSKRIAALKLLSYDTQESRFVTAQKLFRTAIGYYKESILYDERSNPQVYYRQGFTYLMLTPADAYEDTQNRRAAAGAFLKGLDTIRRNFDEAKTGETSEMIQIEHDVRTELQIKSDIPGATPVPEGEEGSIEAIAEFTDENYARMHAGLGQSAFLDAVGKNAEDSYKLALYHFTLAHRTSSRRARRGKQGSLKNKVMNFFNLAEIMEDIPYIVEIAKVHNFMALTYRRQGRTKLVEDHFKRAKDALDEARSEFPGDPRVNAEAARLAFYQRDYNKALVAIEKVLAETDFYADKREFLILQGQIFNEMKKSDEALLAFQWVLDHEPGATQALLGLSRAYAHKGERTSATAGLTTVLQGQEKDPHILRQVAEVYLALNDRQAAAKYLLDAYYIDRKDIELVFRLGELKLQLNETEAARDLLGKVISMNPTSEWAAKARDLLAASR